MICPTVFQETASSMQMTSNSSPRRNRHDILQNSLNISASWSKDWELDINPTKSEHLPIGKFPHFVTYTLPSHNPPSTQTMPTVTTTKGLGIVLNTRLRTEDNVVSAANKARGMLFYLKRSFAALTPSISPPPPCTKPLSDHTWNMLSRQPIPSYAATQKRWKRCKSLL